MGCLICGWVDCCFCVHCQQWPTVPRKALKQSMTKEEKKRPMAAQSLVEIHGGLLTSLTDGKTKSHYWRISPISWFPLWPLTARYPWLMIWCSLSLAHHKTSFLVDKSRNLSCLCLSLVLGSTIRSHQRSPSASILCGQPGEASKRSARCRSSKRKLPRPRKL